MSVTRSKATWRSTDHFEPDANLDPNAQRRLRGNLEQIDYIASAASREVIGAALKSTNAAAFQQLAVSAAQARARWVAAALSASEGGQPLSAAQIESLAALRRAFQETADAYEALRRLVERGYLSYQR
ncbi:hypothetical protein ACO2Q3_26000 [Caulobacter sp. KR2-114]|uniref:hypothetical protein n=1 Tax=Caulobacter sp. KR2-114 TaxID=3400912 RepID=UPI003C1129D4